MDTSSSTVAKSQVGRRVGPHIVFVLADDLGHNGIPQRNPRLVAPALERLGREGAILEDFYTASTCAPARASLMTGRWSYKSLNGNYAWFWIEKGLHQDYSLLPAALARRGYVTAAVGKWHLGHFRRCLLPTSRGFASFYGFLSGCEDHRTQENCCPRCPGDLAVIDLFRDDAPARGENGTDNTGSFARESRAVVRRYAAGIGRREMHRRPLFLYLALQDVHAPFQVEPRYEALHQSSWRHFNVWAGMVSAVDETVHNVSEELRQVKMWSHTLFVFASDNGSPVNDKVGLVWSGGSNAPLRGEKHTLFEGGVRTPAIISGGWLSRRQRGTQLHGICHMVDWYATFCAVSGGSCPEMAEGPSDADGIDLSAWLQGDVERSPRNVVVLGHEPLPPPAQSRRRKRLVQEELLQLGHSPRRPPPPPPSIANATGAIRVGDWKLLLGDQNYISWGGEFSPNATFNATPPDSCRPRRRPQRAKVCWPVPCLFNLRSDPTEHADLAAARPDKLADLLVLFHRLDTDFHAPRQGVKSRKLYCAATASSGGFMVPWRT